MVCRIVLRSAACGHGAWGAECGASISIPCGDLRPATVPLVFHVSEDAGTAHQIHAGFTQGVNARAPRNRSNNLTRAATALSERMASARQLRVAAAKPPKDSAGR